MFSFIKKLIGLLIKLASRSRQMISQFSNEEGNGIKTGQPNVGSKNNRTKEDIEVSNELKTIESKFITKAVNYYLFLESNKLKLSNKQESRLFSGKEMVVAKPTLKLSEYFPFGSPKFSVLLKVIEEKLRKQQYTNNSQGSGINHYKELLYTRARVRARKEIEQIIQNTHQ